MPKNRKEMNMMRKAALFGVMFLLFASTAPADMFDVNIRGVDDGIKTSKQQDQREAVMNAKLRAIELAGEPVDAIIKITSFKLKYETVDAKARNVLLPGFQIVDIGYGEDGTYQVVLVGKAQTGGRSGDMGSVDDPELESVVNLYKQGNEKKALKELAVLEKKGDPETRAQALYLKSMIYSDKHNTLAKATRALDELKALSPDSPSIPKLETVITYRYVSYKIVNDAPDLATGKTVVEVRQKNPFSFTYQDETGKQHKITFPSGSVCVNDDCETFQRRIIRDRAEAAVGRFRFFRDCKEWTNFTRAMTNDDAVDRRCVMTMERTDLGL